MKSHEITTLCLQTALNIHKQICLDEAYSGYGGDFYDMKVLLEQVHTVWHEHPFTLGNPSELEEAWFDAQVKNLFG